MVRVVSALVLVPIVVAAIWLLTPLQLLAFAEGILLLAFRELVTLAERVGTHVPRVVAGTAAVATCAAVALPGAPVSVTLMASMVALAGVSIAAGRSSPERFHDAAAAIFPAIYLGLPLGTLVALHSLAGPRALLLLIASVALSDTAQFYGGRMFGRRPLAPAISPSKTVEGAASGIVAGTAGMALLGRWGLPDVPAGWLIGLGAAVVALGILGDLFESLLKRSAGLKDTAGLIPGHGGLLDRIDALLFATPAYYLFVRFAI